MSPTLDAVGAPRVSAVIVSHDGERWLPNLIRALDTSTRHPHRLIAVDTCSTDASRELLAAAFGDDAVVTAPRTSGFGHGVEVGVAALDGAEASEDPDNEWLWLLHDDCAPAPDALELLLLTLAENPGLAVVGCRMRAWPRAQRLLEVGVTITGTGHRETGLELGEYDQGQHDGIRRVLAVSSAGMLVRRRVWDELGGFDRRLPLFRDDVDFGWRVAKNGGRLVVSPDAVMFHAEASARGVRAIANTSASPHRADRKAAVFTLLANCSAWVFPFQYVRLFLGSLLRALGYLVGKLPSAALDELAGSMAALARPDRIVAARMGRRAITVASPRQVRALLPSWWTPYANGIETVASRFAESLRDTATTIATSARRWRRRDAAATETGPVDDEAIGLAPDAGALETLARHPVRVISIVLTVLALIASRGLWGGGLLQGGALLPAPDGASDWWRLFGQGFHPVALGSTSDASPYVAVLASLATIVLGKAWLVVDLLMFLAVPLCAAGAFVAARSLVDGLGARLWLAVSYGLLPVMTGAVGAGRIGTVVAAITLPWLVRALVLLLDPEGGSQWRRVFGAGLLLSLMTAFCPPAWVTFAVAGVVGLAALAAARRWLSMAQLAVVAVLPLLVLMPWSFRLLGEPSRLLTEAGALDPGLPPVSDHAWQFVFGRIGAPGDAPWWLAVGFVLAALVALLRADKRRQVAVAWAVVAAACVTVALFSDQVLGTDGGLTQAYVWWGFPAIVAQAAGLAAAAIAADGLTAYIQSGTFGFRQPLAAATAAIAVVSPLAGLAWWVVAAPHGDLVRTDDTTLPAYLVDTLRSPEHPRLVVLRGDDAAVDYEVVQDDGYRLGDDSVDPVFGSPELDALLGNVLSEGRPDDIAGLDALGVRYLVMPAPADPSLVAALDGLPGLTRASTDVDALVGWQIVDSDGPVAQDSADGRVWWLVAEGVVLLVVVVLAAPSARRREGIAEVGS